MTTNKHNVLQLAQEVIGEEINALAAMQARLDNHFEQAVSMLLQTTGKVVVMGMGKSGIIGRKIAATLASTGTPAFFVHPAEALHGDLGMVGEEDSALLISYSGETEEVIRVLSFFRDRKSAVVALTGKTQSTLAQYADVVLDIGVAHEACRHNLAPTSSTTCTLVMGDALAVALAEARGFEAEDFARFHPGGSLGRRLLTKVKDVMDHANLPICTPEASFAEVIDRVTRGRMGLTLVMQDDDLLGIITDGDIRRALANGAAALQQTAAEMMTAQPKTIDANQRFMDAEAAMHQAKVGALVVVDEQQKVVGVLHIHHQPTPAS